MTNLEQILKISKSFAQISVQLAADGTKRKSGGVGVRWGLAGRILNGVGVVKPKMIKATPTQYEIEMRPTLLL